MKIVTTTSVFPPCYPAETALERLAAVGFAGLDMAIDYCVEREDYPYMTDKWQDWAKVLREKADILGVSYTHSHACADAAARDDTFLRGFDFCRILGAAYTVVHPIYSSTDGTVIDSEDEFLEVNVRAITPLLEHAVKNNVIILTENLLWGVSRDPRAIAKLVKAVDSPYFGWCFDTGHANCFGITPQVLTEIGTVPLSLHIQDNHGDFRDEHLMPGDGVIDWKEFMEVLHRIKYKGDFVLEAHHQVLESKDSERELILKDLLSRSEKLLEYYRTLL